MAAPTSATDADMLSPTRTSGLGFVAGFYFAAQLLVPVFLVRIAGIDAQPAAAARLAFNFLLLGLVCVDSLIAAGSDSRPKPLLSHHLWVLLYLAFAGCSLLWGEAASPAASAAYWCGTASGVAIVILLLRSDPVAYAPHSLLGGFVWGACLVALIAWMMPVQSDLRLGDEDYLNSNSIANVCAFGVFFAQYLMRRKGSGYVPALLLLTITVLRTLSKATIAAFVLSQGFLLIQDRFMRRRTKVLLSAAALLLVFAFWGLFEAYYDVYTTTGNQAETLTGRTAIWAYVVDAAADHPWLGHGFDSMWKVVPPFGTFQARHAENELLQHLYAFGAVGAVLLCGVYASLYRSLSARRGDPARIVFVCLLLYVLVRGLAEAEPFDLLFPLWAVVLTSRLAGGAPATSPAALQASDVPQPSPV